MAETKTISTITEVSDVNGALDIYTYYQTQIQAAEMLSFLISEIVKTSNQVHFSEGDLGVSTQNLPYFSVNISAQGELIINDTLVSPYTIDGLGTLIYDNVLAVPVLTATTGIIATGFTVNWNAVTGATGYYLDLSIDPHFNSYVAGYQNKSIGNAVLCIISGLVTGTTYYCRVRAVNAFQTSLDSLIKEVSI
jgi:hypothetical protein